MSNIDKRALREAAERALPAMQRLLMMPNDELFDEELLNVDGDVDAANTFNLLTGPETVLALLDELEAETSYREGAFIACNRWHDKFRESEAKLEAAEKRIAELTEIIRSGRKFISEYAGLGDVGAAEFIKIIDRATILQGKND